MISGGAEMFQFTPARGGRRRFVNEIFIPKVSIHARARRATYTPRQDIPSPPRFNSRPRAAGDDIEAFDERVIKVSIHARARRATQLITNFAQDIWFQFTPARGGRRRVVRWLPPHGLVSIHARARRATLPVVVLIGTLLFQFTPARGGRQDGLIAQFDGIWFQFTPARGGRLPLLQLKFRLAAFQFTPARGGRLERAKRGKHGAVSIHARARRATAALRLSRALGRFNSRPRAAGDLRAEAADESVYVSIHARARRATSHMSAAAVGSWFQFTPARGGRPGAT